MARERRYKVSKEIGAGSFATVFAATDSKLNREIAIKQLHKQFLVDKEQLERYWQEAQLLASLEHPNVMTIFDVVKKQGCLVLERMQGTLKEVYGSRPMPVEDVRQVILQAANGLKCLHDNQIVHGDIKPTNLFLSKQEIVKLGDFGLARRVNDDEGSMIKGTTRYMAPELVSEEFGDVGPASDLYSLGFSALEMMVGPEFETLFPDLIAFGRDRQMAWMMWHCSADRKLPPVQTMLEGVPEDLANVIQKLTAKNQSERYTSAKEVIDDLSGKPTVAVGQSVKDEEAAEAEQLRKRKKKLRIIAAVTCLLSTILCLAIVFWPKPKEVVAPEVPPDIVGVVQNVSPLANKLVLDIGTDWKELILEEGDRIRLNRDERQLSNLEIGDRVVVHYKFDENGQKLYDIVAFRPETHTGVISKLQPEAKQFVLTVTEGEKEGTEFLLTATDDLQIVINRLEELSGQPYTYQSLAEGDRVVVKHSDDEQGMMALTVDALRDETLAGVLREIDTRSQIITVDLPASGESADSVVRIPVNPECVIQLNGQTSLNQKLVQLSDLTPGDKVTLEYDVEVKSIEAYRKFGGEGTIVKIDVNSRSFSIKEPSGKVARYSLPETSRISYPNEQLDLVDVRIGDQITSLTHDSPGSAAPPVDQISATRPVDRTKWAVLIGNETFEDAGIAPLTGATANINRIRDAMVNRYAVPSNQILVCNDFKQVRISQEVGDWIKKIPAKAEFYVYVSTRAYGVPDQNVYFAAQDSKYAKIDQSPLTLNWLIDLLDDCATKQKLLLLDCTPADSSNDPLQVSASEMIDIARSTKRGGYPRSVFVLGSCGEDQVGALNQDGQSHFAAVIANGFTGEADLADDNRLEITELADFVQKQVVANNRAQTPSLFLPDPSPPRISQDAKDAILNLLGRFSQRKLDMVELAKQASRVDKQAGGEPEPMTAYGVLLVKSAKMDQALSVFDSVRLKQPTFLPAHRGAIWVNYYKSRYDLGFTKLITMLDHIPTPDELEQPYGKETLAIFEWAGQLRELAESAKWNKRLPTAADLANFDNAVARFGEQPAARIQAGRARVQQVIAGFEQEIAADPDSPARLKRGRLRSYMGSIASEEMINSIKSGLDK